MPDVILKFEGGVVEVHVSGDELLEPIVAKAAAYAAAAAASALQAQDSSGIDFTYGSKGEANNAVGDIPDGAGVQVIVDESQANARTFYRKSNNGLTFVGKIAYVASDLSNVAPGATIPDVLRVGGDVPNSPYLGGISALLRVAGLLAAAKGTNGGEHRLINSWDGNNAASLQNLSNNDGYSAWRFLDYLGREAAALGYGNPGTVADLPFAGAAYFETSSFINADGSPNNNVPPRPMRFVQSGYMQRRDGTKAQGVFGRFSLEANGDFQFYGLAPKWSDAQSRVLAKFSAQAGFYGASFFDIDTLSPLLRVRSKNGYDRGGIVVGSVYEGGANGIPPAQVAADIGGTVVAGTGVDSGRATEMFLGNIQPSYFHYDGSEFVFRAVRPGVAKYDIMFANAAGALPLRVEWIDRDNPLGDGSARSPLRLGLAGTENVYVGGAKSAGGGKQSLAMRNTEQAPQGAIAGGGALFCQDGALKWIGSNGTVTMLAPQ